MKNKAFDSYEIHGLGCYVCWGLLSFLLIVSGRYFKNFRRVRLIFHIIVGILVVVFSMIFTAYEGRGKNDSSKAVSNKLAHTGTAGLTNSLGLVNSIIGVGYLVISLILSLIKKTNSAVWWVPKLTRWVHIYMGYATIIWGNWSVLTGLYTYDSSIKGLILLHFISYIIAFAICETIHCLVKKHKKYGMKEGFESVKKTMTLEEFNT